MHCAISRPLFYYASAGRCEKTYVYLLMSTKETPLAPELLRKMDAYWRAANYLSVGQIYLYGNPLLKESLKLEHVKPRLLGHWGTTPGQNFLYVHLNRLITQ